MALGSEFIILQIGISIVGYIAHQHFDIPLQRVLGVAAIISIISPLLMLDLRTVDLSLTTIIQNYVLIIPEQIVGFVIGSVVTGIIHALKSILKYFNIQIR